MVRKISVRAFAQKKLRDLSSRPDVGLRVTDRVQGASAQSVACHNVRPRVHEQVRDVNGLALPHRLLVHQMKGRSAVCITSVDEGAGCQETGDGAVASVERSQVQGCLSGVVFGVCIGPVIEQQLDLRVNHGLPSEPVESAAPQRVSAVDRRPAQNQLTNGLPIVAPSCLDDSVEALGLDRSSRTRSARSGVV